MTTEAMRAQFEAWWSASKYMQVVYSSDATKQAAFDGYQSAMRSPVVAGLVEAARKVERRLVPLLSGKLRDADHADFVAFFAALANFTGDKP